MCAFASYYTNLGSAEVDKINRDEHFHRAESLLNQASLIRRNGAPGEKEEQLPVLGMAHLKMARGDTAEAEKLLDAARYLKDDGAENIAPMLWKALFLFRRDQFGDALQWYRRALRAHPGAPASVRLGIGACQLRLGQFAQALKAFERALSLEPQNPDALLGAALAELHGASPSSAGDLEAVVYHGWTASRHHVASISGDDRRALEFTNPSERPIGFWTGLDSEGGQRFYVENSLALLDAPGEFYVDGARGLVYYMPLPGEALWGALSANDKAHMAVENGSHVAAVLRVFNGGEEYACAAYDAQHGEEPRRRRLLDSYGESLVPVWKSTSVSGAR